MIGKIRSSKNFFLSIAATDNTGEAGIVKDCRIADYFGYNTLVAVTAVTVQNDDGLKDIFAVPDDFVRHQLLVCSEYPVNCIKIGALGSKDQAEIIACCLDMFPKAIRVWDPVFAPSKGQAFIAKEEIPQVAKTLLPKVDIVTPNMNELVKLSGKQTDRNADFKSAAQVLSAKFNCSFYITGGHSSLTDKSIEEFFIDKENIIRHTKQKTELLYSHGTGCTFSTALACIAGKTRDLCEACRESSHFVDSVYTR